MRYKLFSLFVLLAYYCNSQVPADTTEQEDNAGESGKGFKTERMAGDIKMNEEAEKYIKKAERYFPLGPDKQKKALEYYKKAYLINPDNPQFNFKLGYCYLFSNINRPRSIVYLEKAYNMDKRIDDNIHLYLGMTHQYNSNLETALKHYEMYKKEFTKQNRQLSAGETDSALADLKMRIAECTYGIEMMKNPVRVFMDNLGDSINTEYPEYNQFITPDESMMVFTARRESTRGGKMADVDAYFYEDIYYSTKENGHWAAAKSLPGRMNKKTNDAVSFLSVDGQKMLVYRDGNGGDIYLSKRNGSTWSIPKAIKEINTIYHESSACFSPDGNTIYFTTGKPDTLGYGGKDVYLSRRIKKNKWGAPVNMGAVINSPFDEDRVYMHPNGKILYFSSKGHKSMGGYDIFSATMKDDGTWSEPVNMGFPINTPLDDVSFVITPNGKTGYYASYRPDSKGNKDIYKVTFLGPEKPGFVNTDDNMLANQTKPVSETVIEPQVEVRKNEMSILKGVVRDAVTLEPLFAEIEITDNEQNKMISDLETNSETGKYLVSLASGKNYGIAVKAKGYLFHSENIILPASTNYQVIEKDVNLFKLDVGSKVVLRNIFFDTGKDSLRPESFGELGRLVNLMNDFPYLRIEISGHTDNVGSDESNQDLSQRRANAVTNYLILEGIDPERLEFIGYGEQQPISDNNTEDGRQSNRRTEFKILGTDYKPTKKKKEVPEEKKPVSF